MGVILPTLGIEATVLRVRIESGSDIRRVMDLERFVAEDLEAQKITNIFCNSNKTSLDFIDSRRKGDISIVL